MTFSSTPPDLVDAIILLFFIDVPEPFEPSKLTELAAKVANNPIYQASVSHTNMQNYPA